MAATHPAVNLLDRWSPSQTALLDWLTPYVSKSILAEIAAADYGNKIDEHQEALKRIRDQREIPSPLRWNPREVLELMRWSEPEDPKWKPGSTGKRGHLIRAFCCAVLLEAADSLETRDYIVGENSTLIQLIGSVLYLGNEASEHALRFLCWRVLRRSYDDEDAPFFALGVLLLRAALFEPGQDGTDLYLLAHWVEHEETVARSSKFAVTRSEDWLLGLTFFDQKHDRWRRLSIQVLTNPAKLFPEPAASALRHIVNLIAPTPG